MKSVAGYIRVSSEEQTKGFSLESQKARIEDYAKFKDWKISKFYEDSGISGTSIQKRKAFQQMIKDGKDKKFSVILITKFDRAFRNVVDALNTIDELHKSEIDFVSVTEDIDTTSPMGRALFSIISIFAELESKRNSERVRDTRVNQFSKGLIVGRTHFGYKAIYKDKEHKRGIIKIVPYPKEADIVRDIFKLTAEGMGYKEVCEKYKGKIPRLLKGKIKMGDLEPQSYYNIIRNKVYIGIVVFEGKENKGVHEPLIDESLFLKCNNK